MFLKCATSFPLSPQAWPRSFSGLDYRNVDLHGRQGFYLFCPLLYPQQWEHYLTHIRKDSVRICWVNLLNLWHALPSTFSHISPTTLMVFCNMKSFSWVSPSHTRQFQLPISMASKVCISLCTGDLWPPALPPTSACKEGFPFARDESVLIQTWQVV